MSVKIIRFKNEFRLVAELLLPRAIDEVFAYFSDARNLEKLTPPILHFKITSPGPIQMNTGTTIDYRLRVYGLPLHWTSLISTWDPPRLFVDEQIRGPYRYWIHQHMFEPQGKNTLVKDLVRYQLIGGSIVHDLFVKRDLQKIFSYRQQQLLDYFS